MFCNSNYNEILPRSIDVDLRDTLYIVDVLGETSLSSSMNTKHNKFTNEIDIDNYNKKFTDSKL